MKIKTKKQLNLPQLIEWAMENDIKDRMFLSGCYCVGFDRHGYIYFNSSLTIPLDRTFTVEVEQEITEDTVIPTLVTKNINGDYNEWTDRSVKDFVLAHMEAIYIINDDLTMTLIWRDGKLVE